MIIEPDRFDQSFDSLEAIADTISGELQGPVTIEDANHRLLAYSSHDPQTDAARLATIIGRRVPEKVIRSLWQAGVIQKLMISSDPRPSCRNQGSRSWRSSGRRDSQKQRSSRIYLGS